MSGLSKEQQLDLVLSFEVASQHLLDVNLQAYHECDQLKRMEIVNSVAKKVVESVVGPQYLKDGFVGYAEGTVHGICENIRDAKDNGMNKQGQNIMLKQSVQTLGYSLLNYGIASGYLPNNFEHGPSN